MGNSESRKETETNQNNIFLPDLLAKQIIGDPEINNEDKKDKNISDTSINDKNNKNKEELVIMENNVDNKNDILIKKKGLRI